MRRSLIVLTVAAQWLYWGGFAATLAVAVLVTRTARHAIAQKLAPGDAPL